MQKNVHRMFLNKQIKYSVYTIEKLELWDAFISGILRTEDNF